ncbi:MAG: penicillin acylase family protein [Tahibacter sp.]
MPCVDVNFRRIGLFLALNAALALPALAADPIKIPELRGPASIAYDSEGVPLIKATNDYDIAFLQGYAHARDRFFQMDLSRRAASGSLAELVGQSVLADDVEARTIGLRRAAWLTWNALSDDSRGWLKAYADGVNYWLRSAPLPSDYQALELSRAEPWLPVDSIVIGKALAFQLSFDLDIDPTIAFGAYQQAAAAAHIDAAALYFGDTHRIAPADSRVTVPGFAPAGANGAVAALHSPGDVQTLIGQAADAIAPIDAETLALARDYRARIANNPLIGATLQRHEAQIGSNEWVVAGAHTASGKPILSNDPHLSLGLPSVFTEQHIVQTGSGAFNAAGVTVAGAPGIIQGCNDRVCWGTTTNSLDVTDVFKETFRVNNYGLPYAIVHDGQDEPVDWVFQNFYVNQVGDGQTDNLKRDNSIGYTSGAVTVIVPRRNNGPVVSITGNAGLSVAYVGSGPTFELESFRRINRAQNLAEFQTALSYFDVGSQNFAYADVDGNIAYFTTGEAPIRTDLQTQNAPGGGVPPWFIRDGSGTLKHDWLPVAHPQPNQALKYEILPASEMPHVINPSAGYFANANNDPIGFSLDNNALNQVRPGGGIYYLDVGGASAYRVGRIDRELQKFIAADHLITTSDMKALQANNKLLDAELTLPYLVTAFKRGEQTGSWAPLAAFAADPKLQDAIGRLESWDFSTPTGIPQGYDPGDDASALPTPTQAQINASVAATLFASWRSFAVRATIDATLGRVGLSNYLPGSRDAQAAFKFLLDNFETLGGKGLSGLSFFVATGAPTAADARDYVLLKAFKDSVDRLGSADFTAAFGGSTNLDDYRWGKLHRITFAHPLGGPFNLPGSNPYGFSDLAANLPGLARSGGFEAVDASSHDVRANGVNSFRFGSGPARRFVGEMSTTIAASEIIPGGQSGVLGSPYYASQLGRWLTNAYHPLLIDVSAATTAAPTITQFVP